MVASTALVGCRAEDVAIIGGAVAIIAGVEAKADRLEHEKKHHPPVVVVPTPPPPHRPRCRTYRDYRGRIRSTCPGGYSSLALKTETGAKLELLGQLAMTGNTEALSDLGLTEELITAAFNHRAEALDSRVGTFSSRVATLNSRVGTLARTLDLSVEETAKLVAELAHEVKIQGQDINSALWTTCVANGSWRTDANGGVCQSTEWTGCSPATGASVCSL